MTTESNINLHLDPLLEPLLAAADEAQTERALALLLSEHVEPRIREITGYKLRAFGTGKSSGGDMEDVRNDILMQLLARLRAFKADPRAHLIGNFNSYVAVTAFRACYDYLRRKYPQRYMLKHRLRRQLARHQRLACWQTATGEWLCGLASWQVGNAPAPLSSHALSELRAPIVASWTRAEHLTDALESFFQQIGQPLELDDLVSLIAAWQGLTEPEAGARSETEADARQALENLPEQRASVAEELEQRRYLAQLWHETCQMSARHRAALLLHLRDEQGGSALDLLLFTGVATLAQLAAALEMPPADLLELWNQLPLDDTAIATRLGLRRQQVINLRQTARERLRRRLQAAGF